MNKTFSLVLAIILIASAVPCSQHAPVRRLTPTAVPAAVEPTAAPAVMEPTTAPAAKHDRSACGRGPAGHQRHEGLLSDSSLVEYFPQYPGQLR